ncbi:MAG: hypothetical protein LBO00_10270 [Zoogloeaceae bacterium]|jgi:uncharacterized membrane protein YhiD involved in acid resistance|nr:hypothetical protein [Zoogloeaceae bacterium]
MAKRKSGIGEIIIVTIAFGISSLFGFVVANIVGIIITIIVVAIFFLWIKAKNKKKALLEFEARKQFLIDKYNNIDVVQQILNSEYWIGQTVEQLEDSLGVPAAIDSTKLKTKTKETWKYGEVRKGQFRLRINIENGKVVGWADKSA